MADAAHVSRPFGARARTALRAIHRDVGYSAVGLTIVYAASGIAVNHVADWNPNFKQRTTSHELGAPLGGDDQVATRQVLEKLGIRDTPKEVYREGDELDILFEHRTLHATLASGHVIDENEEPRFFIRVANWLHLNRGKKAWTHFADAYAGALLFLALSGLFMLPGRKGIFGRGGVFVLIGAAVPILYVTLVRG